jgi:adenylate cyclase
MIAVIRKHHGIIVDFYGDGVLVFFDPLDGLINPAAQQAINCSLEMQREMEPFNSEMKIKNLPELQIGIGVNVGEVIVGNIGSEIRAKYGIVGSAVNITQRIQAEAKGREVIISDSAYSLVKKDLKTRKSFSAQLKGVNGKMNLHVVESIRNKPESGG